MSSTHARKMEIAKLQDRIAELVCDHVEAALRELGYSPSDRWREELYNLVAHRLSQGLN